MSGIGTEKEAQKRFKRYPAYRDSGVEWLGEIPAHWEVLAVRRLIGRIEQGWSPVAEDRLAGPDEWAVIKLSAVSKGEFVGDEHKALPADLEPDRRYEIREEDFLLTRANTPELVGDVCVARGVRRGLMLCDLVYRLRLTSTQLTPPHLAYWFLSRAGRHQIEVDARGSSQSMVKVSQGHIRAWSVVLPPADEQRAIAAFLDRETARIDALVAKKERLIELLQEKRTALITRAVTKGLDASASMKDSGVEWLGEIPAHWQVTHLRHACSRVVDCPHETPIYSDGGDHFVIRTSDVSAGLLDLSEARRVDETEFRKRIRRLPVLPDDIVYSREGERFGFAALVPSGMSVCLGQRMMQLRVRSGWSPLFLMWQLNGRFVYQQAALDTTGATSPHVNVETIRNFWLAEPCTADQRAIATFLDGETARTDELVAKVRDAIDRLKELRTALISAAVTGKIDVRGEVAGGASRRTAAEPDWGGRDHFRDPDSSFRH